MYCPPSKQLIQLIPNNGYWYEPVNYDKEDLKEENYQPCRPNAVFILGVVSILEPEIQGLCNFAPPKKPDEIIKHLGLDFDPKLELKKRPQQKINREFETDRQYLDRIRNGD